MLDSLSAISQPLPPSFFASLGSQKVRMQYGPYTVPASTAQGGMQDYITVNITKPCSNCTLTWLQAGLRYPKGSYANIDTGMWLHHVVLFNSGPGRKDTTCANEPAQRFFASGNERTVVNLSVNGTSKTGYYVQNTDTMSLLVELMNTVAQPRDVVLTIDFEYIPGKPDGFSNVTPVWLDIGGCSSSFITPKNNGVSDYTMSPAYTVPADWKIVGTAGHEHDGGTHIDILKNSTQVLCNSEAQYGGSSGYIGMEPDASMDGMMMPMPHLSDMSACDKPYELKKGDTLGVKAYYNMTMHPGMMGPSNELEPIMGIAIVYVQETTKGG